MQQNDTFDILKYVLSLMIIAIHTQLFPMLLYPWLRIAVPLFFILSSYLFFSKSKKQEEHKKNVLVHKYIFKNIKYYFFWFILFFPITIYMRRDWYNASIGKLILNIISNSLFSSTFIASWFIVASIWGVFLLSKTENIKRIYIVISVIIIYFLCCIRSSYYSCFAGNKIINETVSIYESIFTSPVFSFPIALFWMYIGKLFAEIESSKKFYSFCILGIPIFSLALFLEWKFVFILNGSFNNDCYFMLAPLCICIFGIILNCKITFKYAKTLRKVSTISYPLHATLIPCIGFILEMLNIHTSNQLILFFIVILLCHISTYLILKLENKKYWKFLRYSH